MSVSKTIYPLLSTGPIQEDPSRHDLKIVDWDVENQNKQTRGRWLSCRVLDSRPRGCVIEPHRRLCVVS